MITQLGMFLRELRMRNNEILKEMAKKLNVTSAFLSAVENGKKKMPTSMKENIIEIYNLDEEKIRELDDKILESNDSIQINISSASSSKRKLAVSFARTFEDMDEKDVIAFTKYLNNRNKGE